MATGPRWSTRTSPATFRRAIADLLFAGRVLAAKRAGGRSGRSRREMPGDPGLGRPVKINCANHGTLRRSNTQALFNLIRPAALVTCCRGGGTDGVVQPLAHKISESSCAACRLVGDQALESLGQADRQGRRSGVHCPWQRAKPDLVEAVQKGVQVGAFWGRDGVWRFVVFCLERATASAPSCHLVATKTLAQAPLRRATARRRAQASRARE